jgi:hypothetical protein
MSAKEARTADRALKRTPLHALHLALGARMVPFAGYDMSVQYPAGVLKEHLHTRAAASLFDVSHMGQISLRAKSVPRRTRRLRLSSSFLPISPASNPGACAIPTLPTSREVSSTI